MKSFLNLLMVILVSQGFTQAQFVRKWEKSSALGNMPSWFSSTNNNVGGMAFTIQNSGPRLLVISDKQTPTVIILDALTGDSLGKLNTTGISGGLFALNDLTAANNYYPNPVIIGCNLTDNPTISPFKIYVWQDIYSPPHVKVIDSVSTFRLGDHLNASNYFTSDTLHIVTASPGTNKILDYKLLTNFNFFERKVVTLDNILLGSNASVDFNFLISDLYIVNSDNTYPVLYFPDGTFTYFDSSAGSTNNSIKYFSNGTLCCDNPFFITYSYSNNNGSLARWNILWGSTSSLGNNPNLANYGDVDYVWRSNDTLLVFVLAGNNGIGAYHANGFYLPVELISFTAVSNNSYIILNWITASETNNKGFEIQKFIDDKWKNIGFVEGKGTTTEKQTYSFTDKNLEPGRYIYRLKQTDYDGSYEYSNEIEAVIDLAYEFALRQNYPNPFNPNTKINWQAPVGSWQTLKVYDVLGNEVATLVNEYRPAGSYEVEFKSTVVSRQLASGVYVCKLQAGDFVQTRKMILL